MLQNHTESP